MMSESTIIRPLLVLHGDENLNITWKFHAAAELMTRDELINLVGCLAMISARCLVLAGERE